MRVPPQAGRWFAVLVAIPLLVVLAIILYKVPTSNTSVANILLGFAVVFFVYETLWITGLLDSR